MGGGPAHGPCAIWKARGIATASYGTLEALTGLTWRYAVPDKEGSVAAQWSDGAAFAGETWFEMVDAEEGALVRVCGGHSAFAGKAIVSQKRVGKGWVVLLGTIPSYEDARRLLAHATRDLVSAYGAFPSKAA